MDFYVHDEVEEGGVSNGAESNGVESKPRHVGFCFMLPLDLRKSTGTKKIPITGLSSRPIGQIKGTFCLLKFACDLSDKLVS